MRIGVLLKGNFQSLVIDAINKGTLTKEEVRILSDIATAQRQMFDKQRISARTSVVNEYIARALWKIEAGESYWMFNAPNIPWTPNWRDAHRNSLVREIKQQRDAVVKNWYRDYQEKNGSPE